MEMRSIGEWNDLGVANEEKLNEIEHAMGFFTFPGVVLIAAANRE